MSQTADAAAATSDEELANVRDFFAGASGFFVEVGANDPKLGSQTWHLEQQGWSGVLVEPLPALADRLRSERRALVFSVACSSPQNAGNALPLSVAGPHSTLDASAIAWGTTPEGVVNVPVRTLDDILSEAEAPMRIDLLSIDVEGHEIEVLRGFTFDRWQPRLILLEDHVGSLAKHRFLLRAGYKLVRRTGLNGWYVPKSAAVDFGIANKLGLLRKYYLALPVRKLRDALRRRRKQSA